MPNTAAGHISNVPEWVVTTEGGRAPSFWYGDDLLNGAITPWKEASIGSIYIYKAGVSTLPSLNMKVAVAESDDDWAVLSYVRISSGSPMGLLLALTHK